MRNVDVTFVLCKKRHSKPCFLDRNQRRRLRFFYSEENAKLVTNLYANVIESYGETQIFFALCNDPTC